MAFGCARWGILLLLAAGGCAASSDPGTTSTGSVEQAGGASTAQTRTRASAGLGTGDWLRAAADENADVDAGAHADAGAAPSGDSCVNPDDGLVGVQCGSLCCGPTDQMECVNGECQPICSHAQPVCNGACCPEGSLCENGVCMCQDGPLCGGSCCASGESCVNGACTTE